MQSYSYNVDFDIQLSRWGHICNFRPQGAYVVSLYEERKTQQRYCTSYNLTGPSHTQTLLVANVNDESSRNEYVGLSLSYLFSYP